jgi:hypothetical protein
MAKTKDEVTEGEVNSPTVTLTAEEAKAIRGVLKEVEALKESNKRLSEELEAVRVDQAIDTAGKVEDKIQPAGYVNFPNLPEDKNKVVIGFTERGVYSARNAANSLLVEEWIELIITGEKEPKRVLYVDFMKYPRHRYPIVEKKILGARVIDNGLVPRAVFNEKENEFVQTEEVVADRVIIPRSEFVVDINGEKYTVADRFVNI